MKAGRFTWTELFIVVVILAILAAIAVPNFLESARRSPYSKVRSDHRDLAVAIEAYFLDNNSYPAGRHILEYGNLDTPSNRRKLAAAGGELLHTMEWGRAGTHGLTTPVAYVETLPPDRFAPVEKLPFAYYTDQVGWIFFSAGPDGDYDIRNPAEFYYGSAEQPSLALVPFTYDPTNGTVSDGDIWRARE